MKRIYCFSTICLLAFAGNLQAQDAPSTAAAIASRQEAAENYNVLKGHVDDLIAGQADLLKQIQSLKKDLEDLRAQVAKPSGNYASAEDLKKLGDAVKEIDTKREADKELILKEIKTAAGSSHASVKLPPTEPVANADQNGFYYTVKKDDSYSLIAQAYRDQGIKVSAKQIEDANPNVNPAKLHVNMKIFIPAPKGSAPK